MALSIQVVCTTFAIASATSICALRASWFKVCSSGSARCVRNVEQTLQKPGFSTTRVVHAPQKCSRFHPLAEFEKSLRTCRKLLLRQIQRRATRRLAGSVGSTAKNTTRRRRGNVEDENVPENWSTDSATTSASSETAGRCSSACCGALSPRKNVVESALNAFQAFVPLAEPLPPLLDLSQLASWHAHAALFANVPGSPAVGWFDGCYA